MKENEQTRQKIVQAAINIFLKLGYSNTKVSDIVKEAGVAQGTFYLYFKTKEELFIMLVKTYTKQLEDVLVQFQSTQIDKEYTVEEVHQLFYQLFYDLLMIYFENKLILGIGCHEGMNFPELKEIILGFKASLAKIIVMDFSPGSENSDPEIEEMMAYASIGMSMELAYTWFNIRNSGIESVSKLAGVLADISMKMYEC